MTLGEGAADAAEPRQVARAALVRWLTTQLQEEQDRWFLWIPVLFGLGIFAYFKLPAEPSLLAALMPAVIVIALAAVARTGTLGIVAINSALAVSLGFAAAKVRSDWVAAPVLERQLYRVEVEGFLETVEPRSTRGQRVTVWVRRLGNFPPEQTPRRVRLRLMSISADSLEPGQLVRLRANLAPPSMPALPGGYDFARAAWFARLGAVGYSVDRPQILKDGAKPPWSLRFMLATERLRQTIGERVTAVLPGEEGALATALITGERGGISPETTQAFRDSGLVHLLSISGLHMVVMAGSIFYAVRLGLAAIPAIALRYPIKKWAAAIAVVGAFAYLLISGSSFPTVRAWITITIAFGAIMLDRPALALRNVALAALIIIAIAPESLFDAGFQMSFAAVVALVSAYEYIRDRAEQRGVGPGPRFGPILRFLLFFGGIILTTVIASLAVAPFSAFHFNTSQQYAVLANLIAVPVCNIIVMPAALATLIAMPFGLEALPLWVMEKGIRVIVWCAYSVAQLPGAVASIPAFSEVAMGLMLLGGLWLCLWRTRWRLLGIGIFAAGLALAPTMSRPDILVGRNAELVAVRGPQGRLSALPAAGGSYELQRWLESDGDARSYHPASDVFRCDAVGCTANVKNRTVAVVRHPAALAEDCSRADILVIPFPRPKGCNPKEIAIDFYAVRDRGTHAVYIGETGISVVTVVDFRGNRPWSRSPERPRRSGRAERQNAASQTAESIASDDLSETSRRSHSNFEDDDDPVIDQLQAQSEEEP